MKTKSRDITDQNKKKGRRGSKSKSKRGETERTEQVKNLVQCRETEIVKRSRDLFRHKSERRLLLFSLRKKERKIYRILFFGSGNQKVTIILENRVLRLPKLTQFGNPDPIVEEDDEESL